MRKNLFKPKNIYKFHATSRRAGGHTHINKLKEKQELKEVKEMIDEVTRKSGYRD